MLLLRSNIASVKKHSQDFQFVRAYAQTSQRVLALCLLALCEIPTVDKPWFNQEPKLFVFQQVTNGHH
jgi:hypothetical protein